MANIELSRDEVEREDLPAVCMRCGAPAKVQKHKTFGSHAKRIRVPLFFCDRHKHYWVWYGLIVGGSFALLFMLMFGSLCIHELITPATGLFSIEVLGVVLLIDLAILEIVLSTFVLLTEIRARQITKDSITLAGVSKEFVEQVIVFRQRRRLEQETDALQYGPRCPDP